MIYTVSANPALDLILTVPAIEFEVVLRATEVRRELAGKGFNVSRFLHALGEENVAVAFAGGYTGHALEDGLRDMGIGAEFVYVPGETRTNVHIEEPGGRRHIKANQPGAYVDGDGLAALRARIDARVRPGDLWVLTGSLAPGLTPDFYVALTQQLHAAGAQVVLDTSGPALIAGCAARPLLVKPNVLEAEEFTGRRITSPADAAAAAQAFLAAGAQIVILSMGKDGAVVAGTPGAGTPGAAASSAGATQAGEPGAWHIQPPPVQAKTAVGAGDAVVAGAVWAIARGLPVEEIGAWGVATGTVRAMHDALEHEHMAQVIAMHDQLAITALQP